MQNVKFDASALAARIQQATNEDGLEIVPPGMTPPSDGLTHVVLTDRLTQWLLDLRLLRHVPLAYLVPDPNLLPNESIRFFYLDATWADRVIDGALSAADLGTLDMTFTVATMKKMRKALDGLLGVDSSGTVTGMLIRSQLVSRWPDLIVRAYKTDNAPPDQEPINTPGHNYAPTDPLQILRKDALSESVMIVLFAGVPAIVQLREPHVGLRFGVEPGDGPSAYRADGTADPAKYQVPSRNSVGAPVYPAADTHVDVSAKRVVDVQKLSGMPAPGSSRDIAIKLIRPPYVQNIRVKSTNPGSGLNVVGTIKLANNRTIPLSSLAVRR
jgi:hypothetical protein